MARPRPHLNRAPIAEAIVDFKVRARADVRQDEIDTLADSLRPVFPEQSIIRSGQIGISTDPGGGVTHMHHEAPNGRLLRSEHASVVQLRLDGLTYSKLPPYTRWEDTVGEALAVWSKYVAATRPESLTRLAVRYINDMIFPRKRAEDCMSRPPKLPPGFRGEPREFLSRVVIWQEERNLSAIVTQAMGAQPRPDILRLFLDIEVFSEGDRSLDSSETEKALQAMRKLKNRIFFSSLTEEAVEQFA